VLAFYRSRPRGRVPRDDELDDEATDDRTARGVAVSP